MIFQIHLKSSIYNNDNNNNDNNNNNNNNNKFFYEYIFNFTKIFIKNSVLIVN